MCVSKISFQISIKPSLSAINLLFLVIPGECPCTPPSRTNKFPAWGSQGGEQEREPWTGEGGACKGGGGRDVAQGDGPAGCGGGRDGGE